MTHIDPSRPLQPNVWGVLFALNLAACGADPATAPAVDAAAQDQGVSTADDTQVAADAATAGADTIAATVDATTDASAEDAAAADATSAAADTSAAIDAGPPPAAKYQTLSAQELVGWLAKKDFQLINVHVPWSGQIPGTDKNISYTQIAEMEAWLGHNKGAKAVLYCKTGPMSVSAVNKLVKLGYWNLWDLPKGMAGWQVAGQSIDYTKP